MFPPPHLQSPPFQAAPVPSHSTLSALYTEVSRVPRVSLRFKECICRRAGSSPLTLGDLPQLKVTRQPPPPPPPLSLPQFWSWWKGDGWLCAPSREMEQRLVVQWCMVGISLCSDHRKHGMMQYAAPRCQRLKGTALHVRFFPPYLHHEKAM